MTFRTRLRTCLFRLVLLSGSLAAAGVLTVFVVIGIALQFLHRPVAYSPRIQPPNHYTVRGIDVSHHQGHIDWSAVAHSGEVQFAWLKATEGAKHRDRRFQTNWREARAEGIAVGAHFYSMCRSPESQAAHFIRTVPRSERALPPAVDVEMDSRCNRSPPADLQAQLDTYSDLIQAHYGVRPVLYSTHAYIRAHLAQPEHDLWLAGYTRAPRGDWLFWQFSDRGQIAGIRGPVDLNVFREDSDAWTQWTDGINRPAPNPAG